jgi:hypothetical protein
MADDRLPDRWHSRDFRVLLEVARLIDAHEEFDVEALEPALQLSESDVQDALIALESGRYVQLHGNRTASGDMYVFGVTLLERGRRSVGLWPNEEHAADALIDLLTQAADQVEDEDDAGALQRAGRLLRGVPSAVIADVTAALIRQQTGIG